MSSNAPTGSSVSALRAATPGATLLPPVLPKRSWKPHSRTPAAIWPNTLNTAPLHHRSGRGIRPNTGSTTQSVACAAIAALTFDLRTLAFDLLQRPVERDHFFLQVRKRRIIPV